MRFLFLTLLSGLSLFVLSACESYLVNTAQDIVVDVVGVDEAFCDISSKSHRYHLYAPGTIKAERSPDPLKFDCKGPLDRRRIMVVEPIFIDLYYRYPEQVTVDFSVVENATRYNGFRGVSAMTGKPTMLTEESFVPPVETSQKYPIPRTHAIIGKQWRPIVLD